MGNYIDTIAHKLTDNNPFIELPNVLNEVNQFKMEPENNQPLTKRTILKAIMRENQKKRHSVLWRTIHIKDFYIKCRENKNPVVIFTIPRGGDIVQNIRLHNSICVGPVTFSIVGPDDNVHILEEVTFSPAGSIDVSLVPFPVKALRTSQLRVEVELENGNPLTVEHFLNGTNYLEVEFGHCTTQISRYLLNNFIAIPDYDIYVSRGSYYEGYSDWLPELPEEKFNLNDKKILEKNYIYDEVKLNINDINNIDDEVILFEAKNFKNLKINDDDDETKSLP
jgi:hypothetical protein